MKRRGKDRQRLRRRMEEKKKKKRIENWRNSKKNKAIIDFKYYIFLLYSCYKCYIFVICFKSLDWQCWFEK